MGDQGVRWVLAHGRQSYEVDGKFRFWGGLICEVVGAGAGLVEALFDACRDRGVEIAYDAMGDELILDSRGKIAGIKIRGPHGFSEVECSAVILACGGFEANPEMRVRYLGQGWEYAPVRGTAANTRRCVGLRRIRATAYEWPWRRAPARTATTPAAMQSHGTPVPRHTETGVLATCSRNTPTRLA